MAGPKNASIGADGFRYYSWVGLTDKTTPEQAAVLAKYNATAATDVLSVTSIRTLAGEPFQLVNWKIANVVNIAMGVRKQTRIGPRGGVKSVYVQDGSFPGEFVTRIMETRGDEQKLDLVRKWLREAADEPRDIAAVRGTVVHKMIEANTPLARVNDDTVRARFEEQWKLERRKVALEITDEDLHFVTNSLRQYWAMRATVPFVILAQEPQVWGLTAGFAGSADALIWFLGDFDASGQFVALPGVGVEQIVHWQREAANGRVAIATIDEIGGIVALGDWKTGAGLYSSHVVQGTAYMAADIVGADGVIDERLTDILRASRRGMIAHIRPNYWEVAFFNFREDIVYAFLGSVAFARFLVRFKTPDELFTHVVKGVAAGTEPSIDEGIDA